MKTYIALHKPFILVLFCGLAGLAGAQGQNVLPISLGEGWIEQTEGPWRMRYDHRELLAMYHPWVASQKGNRALVSRDVTAPADWKGPIILSFYCSDDYQAVKGDKSKGTAEGFVGHRVKQVLVDDRVVWNVDVSDPVEKGRSPYYKIELPVQPGQKFMLTLLVYDAVDSATVLEGDFYEPAQKGTKRENDPDAAKFMTHVYWGDVVVAEAGAEIEPGRRPVDKLVRSVHTKKWPLPQFGDEWKQPITLEVSAPAGVPKQGFPVRCGVPLHAGKVKSLKDLTIKRGNKAFWAQKASIGQWTDESVQWVLLEFPVKPDTKTVDLAFGQDKTKAPGTVKVNSKGTATAVDAGLIKFEAEQGSALSNIQLSGKNSVSFIRLSLQNGDEEVTGVTESIDTQDEGAFRRTVTLEGRFDSTDKTLGRFNLSISAYAGMPYLALRARLYNDTDKPLPVSGLRLKFGLPEEPGEWRVPSGTVGDTLVLTQTSEKDRTLNDEAVNEAEPAYVAWKGGVVAVPKFRELFPKQASVKGKELTVDLVAAEKSPIVFTPGECKTHEVWLALGDVDPAAFASAVEHPPILQNAAYYCSTGALGPAAVYGGVLKERMEAAYGGKTWEDLGQHFGVRDFPDSPYVGGLPRWCNNYYERMLGLWSQYFVSGDRVWYDRAVDVTRHIFDVAVVHSEVPGKDWLGAMHGPGENHVAEPWAPVMRTEGLDLYYKLTGDEAARDAVVAAADYCVRTKMGMDSESIRDHAGPFDAVCTAYDETGNVDYLDDGAARVESVMKSMDMRRGVWADEHGSRVYRGNVPWMAVQLARPLYLWYRATGDVQAAEALVALAESIICENTDWDTPGAVTGYSHNPHFAPTAQYDPLIVPMMFAAYELTEDTFFLDAAKAQWARWEATGQAPSVLNDYWNAPWLAWYLEKYSNNGKQ